MVNSQLLSRTKLFKLFSLILGAVLVIYILWKLIFSSYEYTDNAYAAADIAQMTSSINAIVDDIKVSDGDIVNAGDILVVLDDVDLKLSLREAEANLAKNELDLLKARDDFTRRKKLSQNTSIPQEEIIHAESKLKVAQANVLQAQAALEQVQVQLNRAKVKAPISGIIAKKEVKLGQYVVKGSPLLSIVPVDKIYVNANFKEVQLQNINIGQDVELYSDLHGKSELYRGKVLRIAGGTGSAFAIIPAQNATGNWIKVVQRVPVVISINPEDLKSHPLRVGLSMHAKVKFGGK